MSPCVAAMLTKDECTISTVGADLEISGIHNLYELKSDKWPDKWNLFKKKKKKRVGFSVTSKNFALL